MTRAKDISKIITAPVLSGLTYPTSDGSANQFMKTDGSGNLTFASVAQENTTINNNADNRIITGSGTANTLEGEANLTFDGTTLGLTGSLTVSGAFTSQGIDDNADATAITINSSEQVGIGTASHAGNTKLHVSGTAQKLARFERTGSATSHIEFHDSTTSNQASLGSVGDNLSFETAFTERMRIDSSGRVGIGTASPIATLHTASGSSGRSWSNGVDRVIHEANATNIMQIVTSTTGTSGVNFADTDARAVSGVEYDHNAKSMAISVNEGSGTIKFFNTSERMRIDTSGNVGIGTSTIQSWARLELQGSAGAQTGANQVLHIRAPSTTAGQGVGIRLSASSGSHEAVGIIGVVNNPSGNAGSMTFHTYNGGGDIPERMRIDSSGNVGINVTNPQRSLEVNGIGRFLNTVLIGGSNGNTNYNGYFANQSFGNNASSDTVTLGTHSTRPLIFATNTTERMRIDGSSGNVGIGTTNATNLLHLAGTFGLGKAAMSSATTSGDFTITLSNLTTLNGANWREHGLLMYYMGVDGSLANSTTLFTSIRLRGLNTWDASVQSNIISTATISASSKTTTGVTITVDVPNSNNGTVFVLCLGGNNTPSISISG